MAGRSSYCSSVILLSMRRPARPLFSLCSAASLMLCLAAITLWVRTALLNRFDDFEYVSPRVMGGVWLARGRLYVHHMSVTRPWWQPRPQRWTYTASSGEYAEPSVDPHLGERNLGFDFARQRGTSSGLSYVETWTVAPLWAVTVVTAVMPAWWLA